MWQDHPWQTHRVSRMKRKQSPITHTQTHASDIVRASSMVYEMHPNDDIKSAIIMCRRHNTTFFACQFLFSYESFIFICGRTLAHTHAHTRIWISSKYSHRTFLYSTIHFPYGSVFLFLVFRVRSKHAIHQMKMEDAWFECCIVFFIYLMGVSSPQQIHATNYCDRAN